MSLRTQHPRASRGLSGGACPPVGHSSHAAQGTISAHCWLMVSSLPTSTPRSLSAEPVTAACTGAVMNFSSLRRFPRTAAQPSATPRTGCTFQLPVCHNVVQTVCCPASPLHSQALIRAWPGCVGAPAGQHMRAVPNLPKRSLFLHICAVVNIVIHADIPKFRRTILIQPVPHCSTTKAAAPGNIVS